MKRKLTVPLLLALLVFFACRHEIPFPDLNPGNGTGPTGGSNPCSPDSVYFANTILPLISSNCAMSGCHDPVTQEEDLILNNYNGIMKIVRPGNAAGSKLYVVITKTDPGDIMPPPPHSPLSAANIELIRKWINQGAKNNQCASPCDTSVFSYSVAVSPMMNTYCKGCHNPASLGGGIDLSTYNGVKPVALDGRLLGSIKHATGYKAMPQGGNKLQDCQIRQIEKWIQSGSPNN